MRQIICIKRLRCIQEVKMIEYSFALQDENKHNEHGQESFLL